MGVLNGQLANQDTFNEAFLDKNADTETSNKITLSDPDEGSTVDSVQGSINEIFDTQGTSEGDANAKVYANTNYIADGDSQKTAIEKLDAQAGTSNTSLTTHVADLTAHRNFDTLANLTTWAATADNGWFAFATDAKQSFQVIDGALEPIGGGGGFNYLGTWNASTNTPTLPVGDEENGDFYIVSVAGTQDIGNGSVDWAVGDWAIYNDLTGFLKIDNSELVSNVNGQTGAVVLDADDIAETATRYWDVKNNRTATTNPTVTNDDTENYSQGSTWLNTSTGTMYVCTDASTGAAIWKIQSGSDSKNTRWGNINRNTVSSSDWVATGDAAVTDTSTDGSIQDSFQVNTGTAGNTAEIEHIIPPAAIDVRYNQAVIEYQLFDITDPVVCTVLDWNDNTIGQVELPQTGSGAATADNLRFAHATVDFSFPFAHGSTFRSVKFQFECASDITAGQFLVNFIQSDSNARDIGQWVDEGFLLMNGYAGKNGSTVYFTSVEDKSMSKFGAYTNTSSGFKFTASTSFTADIRFFSNTLTAVASDASIYLNGSVLTQEGDGSASFKRMNPSYTQPLVDGDEIEFLLSGAAAGAEMKAVIRATRDRRSIMSEVESVFNEWQIESGVTIEATTTDPIKPTTVDVEEIAYRRNGQDILANFRYYAASTAGSTAGSGDYLFTLPNSLRFDSGIVDFYTTAEGIGVWQIPTGQTYGVGTIADGTNQFTGFVVPYDETRFRLFGYYSNIYGVAGNGFFPLTGNETISINLRAPIEGWSTKEIVSIPVDEIIADGNEYPVFGKRINVGGVWYQVFRRGFTGASATKATGLPLTLKPVSNSWVRQPGNSLYSNVVGTASNFVRHDYYYSGVNAGDLVVSNTGAYDGTDIVYSFDYYDTARPLYS